MARIPILQDPGQLNTGNQTIRTPDLPAVTNASMGKALGNLGNVAFDIAEKAKRANDVTKLTEASLAMNKAQMDFATFQQSPEGQDEKQWLPKWQSLQNGIKTQFDQAELTPEARMQFNDRLSNWATRGTINVQAQAFKQAGQRMEDAIETAVVNRDYNTANQGVDDAVSAGAMTSQAGALKKARIAATKKDDLYNTYVTQKQRLAAKGSRTMQSLAELERHLDAARDSMKPADYQLEVDNLNDAKEELIVQMDTINEPEMVINSLDAKDANGNHTYAPNLDSLQQREALRNQALARIEEMQMEEQRAVMNGILGGSIQNMKQAETLMPRSDAIAKAKIQSVFDKKPPTQYEASILKRALEKAVEEYDPTNDPEDAKTFQIVDTINRLNLYDEKLTSSLREKFYKKQQQRTPPSPIESEIANHKKFLDYVYEPKLKALMDEDTKEVPVDKQAEFRSLLSIRDQLATDFERMVESGEIKTREQARNASVRMLAEPYADQVMDYFRYAPSSEGKSGQIQLTPEEIQQIEKQRLLK
jgi:hypothetical protein